MCVWSKPWAIGALLFEEKSLPQVVYQMQLIVPHNKLTDKMQNAANMYDLYRHEV